MTDDLLETQIKLPPVKAIIFLEAIEVMVDIGVHDFEQLAPQRLLVDVTLTLAPDAVNDDQADDVSDVVDYEYLSVGIRALALDRRWVLQETFAREVLRLALGPDQVIAARIWVRKPDVYEDARSIGLILEAEKEKIQI